ncbi:MAG: ABC transporter permease [Butyricimonas faecihominis]
MERIRIYFKPIWYNIIHYKAYAGFCVFGTMLTFVFITILLQVACVILCNTAPAVAADRIVSVPFVLRDNKGEAVKGLNKSDIRTLMNNVREEVCYTSYHYEAVDIIVNGRYDEYGIYFIDHDYWNVFQFEFLQGHFFTEDEIQMPCVIVNENFVRSFFSDKSVINKEIQIEGNTYRITGVVADVSYFAPQGKASLWVPEKFCKNESNDWVETYILYPENMSTETIIRSVTNAYQFFVKTYYNIDKSVSVKQISTEKQFIREMYGGGLFLSGVGVMIFILLVVPVLNIVLLSMANTVCK